ncbi:MAG: hypothetical protein ACE367_06810 [Acidimicrobiales bacterium]
MAGLIILASLGVLVAGVVSAVQRRSRLQPLWARAAADLGLPPPTGGPLADPSISGRVDGRHLTVRERSGDDKVWIEYELAILRSLPAGLTISSEHLGSRIPVLGKLFSGGREQVETGDGAFDEAFIVTGDDSDEVRAFLTDERRTCLVRLAQECPGFELKRGELTYRFNDRSEKIADLARPAHAMVAAARVLSPSGAGSASHRGRAGDGEAAAGQIFPGAEQRLSPPSGRPPGIEPPVTTSSATSTTTAATDAATTTDDVAADAAAAPPVAVSPIEGRTEATSSDVPGVVFPVVGPGADPADFDDVGPVGETVGPAGLLDPADATGEADGADAAGSEIPGEARALEGAEDPGAAVTAVDQAPALAAVFGVSAGAGAAVFDERLRGRRVRWSGTVERAGRYANDLDLGAGPGIRAVVDLGSVDTGDYGVARVAAVVAFPLDAAVGDGDPVTFEGTAASLDHFARRVVVTDATVVAG